MDYTRLDIGALNRMNLSIETTKQYLKKKESSQVFDSTIDEIIDSLKIVFHEVIDFIDFLNLEKLSIDEVLDDGVPYIEKLLMKQYEIISLIR